MCLQKLRKRIHSMTKLAVGNMISLTFLFFIETAMLSRHLLSSTLMEVGPCDCGIFHSHNLSAPFFIQRINYNMCNSFSAAMCNELCITLNTGAIDMDVMAICNLIEDGIDIYMKIYSRMCVNNWMDTNLSPTDPICCENGIDVPCEETN